MPKNNQGEELCTFLVEGYGVCSRRQAHMVHQGLGISPVEHPFHREIYGEIEVTHLSEESIPYISQRSGMKQEDLLIMLASAEHQGKSISVRYEVKE